jgi:hypothetical protein
VNRSDKNEKAQSICVVRVKALERAAAKVAENARKNKYQIPAWKNGRIEYEIPEIITDKRINSDPKS